MAAKAVGVDRTTIHRAMKADQAFADAVTQAEASADEEVEDALRMAAISGNVTACLAWLYSRQPERWSDTRRNDRPPPDASVSITVTRTSDAPNRE